MMRIYFLNVGHGHCTIVEHASGNRTMIDINNAPVLDDDSRRELAEEYGIVGMDYEFKRYRANLHRESFRKAALAEKGYDIPLTDPVQYYKANWAGIQFSDISNPTQTWITCGD